MKKSKSSKMNNASTMREKVKTPKSRTRRIRHKSYEWVEGPVSAVRLGVNNGQGKEQMFATRIQKTGRKP